ncbi:hypothetical protein A3Q56_00158 [Intoshia linei]|uniref:Death domain-containing protein n=1 Tax=Intoshia linei TaxID=1819745 RepID=A0A177BCP1_9BILA|nr:hypothetical protein A3Q56_00158 [Intoshia linei]
MKKKKGSRRINNKPSAINEKTEYTEKLEKKVELLQSQLSNIDSMILSFKTKHLENSKLLKIDEIDNKASRMLRQVKLNFLNYESLNKSDNESFTSHETKSNQFSISQKEENIQSQEPTIDGDSKFDSKSGTTSVLDFNICDYTQLVKNLNELVVLKAYYDTSIETKIYQLEKENSNLLIQNQNINIKLRDARFIIDEINRTSKNLKLSNQIQRLMEIQDLKQNDIYPEEFVDEIYQNTILNTTNDCIIKKKSKETKLTDINDNLLNQICSALSVDDSEVTGWRQFSKLVHVNLSEYPEIENSANPMKSVIKVWMELNSTKELTISHLYSILVCTPLRKFNLAQYLYHFYDLNN